MVQRTRILGEEGRIHHVLLALTILLVAVQPLTSTTGELFSRLVFGFVVVGCMAAVYGRRRLFLVGLLLGVPTLVFLLADMGGLAGLNPEAGRVGNLSELTLGIATLAFVCVVLLGGIYRRPEVTAQSVSTSLTVYLLLGILWANAFLLVEILSPGSFYGLSEGGLPAARRDLFYYSFVTLTTLGYGDIGPTGEGARALAITEAVIGQLYLVVLVASLVSGFLNEKSRASGAD